MSCRKQEITGLSNERDFPHLVEFALSPGGFRSVFLEFDAFHREQSIRDFAMSQECRLCSLIPGFGVKLSRLSLPGPLFSPR